ncbi:HNH endonuclease family protein [Streptomyces morookaense]|nr:HNH endonuclease family protein [Streptomyces morookaense]GHF46231.1 hypothetical protein GCM10010359_55880 [Streptomyces morookaense]
MAPQHSMTGYARSKFDIWAKHGHCTTRQAVLARDGKGVVDKPGSCQPAKGSWYSPYDGTTITTVSQATIDHLVPLAAAWRAGADKCTADQRRDFGNDLKDPQLIIASEPSNSAKGDSGPDRWKPQNKAFWCTYAEDYTHVKAKWKLTTTTAEKKALGNMLDTCS